MNDHVCSSVHARCVCALSKVRVLTLPPRPRLPPGARPPPVRTQLWLVMSSLNLTSTFSSRAHLKRSWLMRIFLCTMVVR